MQETNTPAPPNMNLGEALEQSWGGFDNADLDQEFPQSPVDSPMGENSNVNQSDHGGDDDDSSSDWYTDDSDDDDDSPSIEYGNGSTIFGQLTNRQIEKSSSKKSDKKSPGFLTLPYEIRRMIYQNLLQAREPISSAHHGWGFMPYQPYFFRHDVHPQISYTCRQIHSECRGMLINENMFSVSVWDFFNSYQCGDQCKPIEPTIRGLPPWIFQRMKRIEVLIEHSRVQSALMGAILATARVLSQSPELKHVSIKVDPDVYISPTVENLPVELDPLRCFEMVRNVQRVTVEGVSPGWQQYLIETMTSASPIPRMYYALEAYASPIACARSALERAYDAAGPGKLEEFLEARQEVIDAVNRHMGHVANHLFDHDPIEEQSRMCTRLNNSRPLEEQALKCMPSSGCSHC